MSHNKKPVTLKEIQESAELAERGASRLKELLRDFEALSGNGHRTKQALLEYEPIARQEFADMLQRIIDFRCILSDFLDENGGLNRNDVLQTERRADHLQQPRHPQKLP